MYQYERLHAYLKQNGSITPLAAWTELGIYRLSDSVLKLRKRGVSIKTAHVEVKNQFEESCHVAKYILK
jgi:hypothetical protein